MLLTLAQARVLLWQYASQVDPASATAADNAQVNGVINQVCERFLTNAKVKGSIQNYVFPVLDNYVTLPANVVTILQANLVNTNGTTGFTYKIFNRWNASGAFSQYGQGTPCGATNVGIGNSILGSTWTPRLFDVGNGFTGYRPGLTGTYTIRATTTTTEPGTATILLQGIDQNGNTIQSGTNTNGVSLTIPAGGSATTSQQFTQLSYWAKSVVTNGNIALSAVDTTSGVVTPFALIVPGNLTSNFRRYYAPDNKADNTDTILASCKHDYVPAIADTDPIIPSNVGALKLGMIALQCEDKFDFERSDKNMARALDLLDQDRQEFDGDSAIAPLQFVGDYAAGSIASRPL